MKPYHINEKKNFISGWYIDPELCDAITALCVGKNRLRFNPDTKPTFRGYLVSKLENLSSELQNKYTAELTKVIDLYIEEYPFIKELVPLEHRNQHVQVQVYDPKFSYSALHCENSGVPDNIDRCLVFLTYLNDVDDGGGTFFPYQNLETKAEKGLTLVWPAYWTHPHKGVVSNTESKIITTGWYGFKSIT